MPSDHDHEDRLSLFEEAQANGALNLQINDARKNFKDMPFNIVLAHCGSSPGTDFLRGLVASPRMSLNVKRTARAALQTGKSAFSISLPRVMCQPIFDENETGQALLTNTSASKFGEVIILLGFGGVSFQSVFVPPEPLGDLPTVVMELKKFLGTNKDSCTYFGESKWGSFKEMEKDLHKTLWDNPGNN